MKTGIRKKAQALLSDIREDGADQPLIATVAQQFPVGLSAQQKGERVNHDGFAGSGFTRHSRKTARKTHIHPGDNRHIFNMQ